MARDAAEIATNDAERAVFERCRSGEVADFAGAARRPSLRPAFLAALALTAPPRGIRIAGARIDGALDLTDCALPALALNSCDIAGQLDLSGARLGRLSIKGSHFSGLLARAAAIDGQVDVTSARALAGKSWIDLAAATIRGGIEGCDAELHSPPARAKETVPPWDHHYALRLSDAHVGGSILLNGKAVVTGGLCLDNAHVEGSVWARGATIAAGEGNSFHPGDAIHGHDVRIGGMLGLNFDFNAVGRVWLLGARIGDRITVGFGGSLKRVGESWDWDNRLLNQTVLLLFDQAEIAGGCFISDIMIAGSISLNNARIGANLAFASCRIGNRTPDGKGTAVTAEAARIDGNVAFGKDCVAEGRVSFAAARIGGHFDCRGARFNNQTEDGKGVALDAEWAEIGRSVRPAGLAKDGSGEGFTAAGRVSFAHAKIG